jgi:SAM-dependent methyltransferase
MTPPVDRAESFYGTDQASIHHREFGDLAAAAAESLLARLADAGLTVGTVVDLGCGSGVLAAAVSEAGYRVLGVDVSGDMIDLARAHAPKAELVEGSVHDVVLPRAVAVTAVGEVLNYATDARAGVDALRDLAVRAHAALEPGGLFLFDVSTPGRLGPSHRRLVFHDREDWSLAMEADEDDRSLVRRIVVFRRTGDGLYRRTDERHVLRLYEPDEVESILRDAGFMVDRRAGYGDDATRSTPTSGWVVFVARKEGRR